MVREIKLNVKLFTINLIFDLVLVFWVVLLICKLNVNEILVIVVLVNKTYRSGW